MAKTIKKSNKKVVTKPQTQGDELKRLIQMVVIVVVLFLAFYFITTIVTRKEEKEETKIPATIQYDEILISNILEQPNDKYYVLIADLDDIDVGYYSIQLANYKSQKDSIRYYTATLDNIFNKSFKADKSNFKIKNITDLKVKTSTLLLVEKGKIKASYEGSEAIKKHLLSIIKTDEKK